MTLKIKGIIIFILFFWITAFSQQVVNSTLIKADKLFIKHSYTVAVTHYVKYLEQYPKDYYASRQAAICYDKLNDPNSAIDYWPIVVESSEATEKDYLEYGKSLLANNRGEEARKVFILLSRSLDKSIAAWGKAYLNPNALFVEAEKCNVIETVGINTDKSEFCPVMYKEKLLNVFDLRKPLRIFNALTDLEVQKISAAIKKDSVTFFPALVYEKLQNKNINSQFCFSPDGTILYFSLAVSNKELKAKSDEPFFKFQLFELKISTLSDLKPEIKPFKFNAPEFDFMHPSVSGDGKKLYFASNMKGSLGGKDIFVCEWTGSDWAAPANVGSEINSSGNEVFPHISQEGVLYFSSDLRPGLGGLDIFYAEPSSDTTGINHFNECKNAGKDMNSKYDDFGLYLLKGGRKGYLTSNRKNNTDDDIYYFIKAAGN